MFEEKTEPLVLHFLENLGKISYWQDASKACFISLGSCIMMFTFLLWWGVHFVQLVGFGVRYLPYSQEQLIQAIQYSSILTLLMAVTFCVAATCVYKDIYQKAVLNLTLFLASFSLSILLAIIGVFDGISWLIILIYTAIGFIFTPYKQVFFSVLSLVCFLIVWSVIAEWMPFEVRAYQFTESISLNTMNLTAFLVSWARTLSTLFLCLVALYILMGAWQHREKDLRSKSFIDELTGLYNRRAIQDGLKEEYFRAKRGEYHLSIAMLDLDHFKQVNDDYGHPFGDEVLRIIASLMIEVTRNKDLVGRYGGEEFLIIFPECTGNQAEIVLNRLRENIVNSHAIMVARKPTNITVSAGVAELKPYDSIDDMIKRADLALYHAKNQGRNRVIYE